MVAVESYTDTDLNDDKNITLHYGAFFTEKLPMQTHCSKWVWKRDYINLYRLEVFVHGLHTPASHLLMRESVRNLDSLGL